MDRDVYSLSLEDRDPSKPSADEGGLWSILEKKPVFVYAKVPVSPIGQAARLEERGFHLVDTAVAFVKSIGEEGHCPCAHDLRFARPEDEQQVADVARCSFSFSRFHRDQAFSRDAADDLKAQWARNYFIGKRGDAMVVAEADGVVAGFLQLLCNRDSKVLTVDLIAVDPRFQRMGCAAEMLRYAENQLEGFETIKVGTQLANKPSLRLYEGLGFRISDAHYVFHYHQG